MYKYLSTLFLIFFLGFYYDVNAQNLVPNPSFEEYSELPNEVVQWYKCIGWDNVNDSIISGYASPDYFHTDAGGANVSLPYSFFADVYPYDGDAIMGFSTNDGGVLENYREYISTRLKSPLVPGLIYHVKFNLTNGKNDYYNEVGVNNIGALLSTKKPVQDSTECILRSPQILIEEKIWNPEWQTYDFTFLADSAYEYITFGCFADIENAEFHFVGEDQLKMTYTYIDDVEVSYTVIVDSVVEICLGDSVQLTAYNDTTYRWYNNDIPGLLISSDSILTVRPVDTTIYTVYGVSTSASVIVIPSLEYCEPTLDMPNVFTPNSDGINDFYTYITQYAIRSGTLQLVNRWGTMVFEDSLYGKGWDGNYNGSPCTDGTYYWVVNIVGYNGAILNMNGSFKLLR